MKNFYNDSDFEGEDIENMATARRREFPDMIRDLVSVGHPYINIRLDKNTALNLADDIEYAVKNRKIL